jgi:hypothetical protein
MGGNVTRMGDEKFLQNCRKTGMKGSDHVGDPCVDGKIMFTLISKKSEATMCRELLCSRQRPAAS